MRMHNFKHIRLLIHFWDSFLAFWDFGNFRNDDDSHPDFLTKESPLSV